nr:flagellar motor protein MotB [Lysinibacillus timonensis]
MAKKSKRHKKHEEHIPESWLVPYADILTLLLALFIVLFASSTVDQEKMEQMSQVFSQIFDGGTGFMDENAAIQQSQVVGKVSEENQAYLEDQEALKEIQNEVDNFIAVNELEDTFATSMTGAGLIITIHDNVLFDPGKADVKAEYFGVADELSKILELDPLRHVTITGHTDNVPQNSAQFSSNWDLSVMRAVNLLEIILERNPELDPSYFSAKGYGEYKPIATNDTAEGRAQNRRVEVLIQQLINEDGTKNNIE